jgi:hypothetical protein
MYELINREQQMTTHQQLEQQYFMSQPPWTEPPQPAVFTLPTPVAEKSALPALLTLASLGLLALSDDEKLTALALQGVAVGGTAWLGQCLQ